jgi:hypothetical protein
MPNKDMIKARKQFVGANRGSGKSDAQLRRKFFVKTRLEEMRSAGKTVDAGTRKRLVERYKSGNVKRAEFYAGGEKERAKRRSAGEAKPAAAASRPASKPTVGTSMATANAKGGTLVKGSKAGAAGARVAEGRKYGTPEIAASKKKSMQSQNPSSRNRRTAYGSPESALSAAKARKAATAKKSSKAK